MKLLRRACLAFLFVAISCAQLLATDVRIGLVSYWPFETVNGNNTPDLVFGNPLVLDNMTETNLVANAGVRGSAFSFNGSNQMQADFAFPAGNARFYRISRSAP